ASGAQPRQVIHHGVAAARLIGPLAAMVEDRVAMRQRCRSPGLDDKSLHEDAIETVLLHPAKVPQYGLLLMGAEDIGRPAVGILKGRDEFLVVLQLAHIGPKIDVAAARTEFPALRIVPPAHLGPTPSGGEPALISGHALAG